MSIIHLAFVHCRRFARAHDQLPAFHASYLILTIFIAGMLSLGCFGLLVLLHMGLDVVKYRDVHGMTWFRTAEMTLRESLVDIMLLGIGALFTVYLHHSLGIIAGLSGIQRAEVTLIRATGTVIPKLKILDDVLKTVWHLHEYLSQVPLRLQKRWAMHEYAALAILVGVISLIAAAPMLLDIAPRHLMRILLTELTPHF